MNGPYTRRSVLAVGAAGGLAALAGCAGYLGPTSTNESTETVTLDGASELTAESGNGDAGVRADDALTDTVEVHVTKRVRGDTGLFGDVALVVASGDDRVEISVEYETTASRQVRVDLDVRVPPELTVIDVSSANGDASVEGTSGDTTISTANGDATATGASGTLELQSANGDVEATDCAGVTSARTGNGDVELDVRGVSESLEASSANGDVAVAVPADTDAEVLLRTGNGDITTDIEFTDSNRVDGRFEGTLGDGGPSIELFSGNGDVELFAR